MSSAVRIIGLGGTNGSGKDTVGHILAEQYGWLFVSVSDLLRDECRARGLEVKRENLRTISAEWRRGHGLDVLVDKALEYYRAQKSSYHGLAIASIRNPGEVTRIHDLGGMMVWVDADPKIRYERTQSGNRDRAGEDNKTYEEFLAEEAAEMQSSGNDSAALDGSAVKAQADVTIINEFDNLDALAQAIVQQLQP